MPIDRRAFLTETTAAVAASVLTRDRAPRATPDATTLKVQRLSWAGVRLELGDSTLLIDPWTSTSTWDGAWKGDVVPVDITTKERNVLITHMHNDHFDQPLLKTLITEHGAVVCIREKAAPVASRGFRTWALGLYEPFVLGSVGTWTVVPVPAEDGLGELQVAWVVTAGGRRIIHCGDTMWHGRFGIIGRQYGPFDVAFLPINGADFIKGPLRTGLPLSLTPEQAAAAGHMLGATRVVPIHYGLNDPNEYVEYPNALPTFLQAAKQRGVRVDVLQPGQWLDWS
jgi:L-ascorbate metabolism protein UlaG (beta-lactamase superfamily)